MNLPDKNIASTPVTSAHVSTMNGSTDWLNRLFAALAFVISAIVYLKTVAPTFSFWDCGEFVACSATLGIAHPPGSPLYILLGRLFAVAPIGGDIGWRINLISVFSFAFATMIGYLIAKRLGDSLWGSVRGVGRRLAEKLTINLASLSGALLLAFGLTTWASAVEAEVYGLAMAIYFAIIWLVMAAYQAQSPGARTRYALLALYLMVLGIGVHMTVALAAVVVIPIFALKEARQRDWMLLTIFALVELYLIFALSSRPGEIPLALPLALVVTGLLFHIFSLQNTPRALLITVGVMSLGALPIVFDIWRIARGAETPGFVRSIESAPLNLAGLVLTALWGGYLGYKVWLHYRAGSKRRATTADSFSASGYLTSLYYILCALFLVAMTEYVRGYTSFLIITALLGAGVLFALRSRVNWMLAIAALAASGMILGFWEFVHGTLMVAPIITALEYVRFREKRNPLSMFHKSVLGSFFVSIAFALYKTGVLGSEPLNSAAVLGAIAVISVLLLIFARKSSSSADFALSSHWKSAVVIVVLALIGYSTNLTVPVRSSRSPMIDQNNPSRSVTAFVGYIERKQYGRTSMTKRMFTRRAEWLSQFGDHRRMGFWEFFRQQYGVGGWKFPALFVVGIFGLWELIRRNKVLGGVLFISLLAGTVGLILYMNFADGSRMIGGADYLEVRDRDYFFTPGFMIFGLVIGLGVIALLRLLQDVIPSPESRLRYLLPLVAASSLALPALAVAYNYEVEDRSGNFIPYDYATNLLDSAEENAILITGGDNDTFPLWALQAAYNYRLDVAVLNLSLSNTDWYLKQMRDNWDVPLPLTDKQIEGLRYRRYQDGRLSRIQDQIVDILLLTAGKHKRPINFAKTIPSSGRKIQGESIDNRLTARGRVYVVRPDSGGFVLALGESDSLFTRVLSYRGLGRDGVYQDPVSRGMTNSYAADFLNLTRIYRSRESWGDVKRVLAKAIEVFPRDSRINAEYAEGLYKTGDSAGLIAFADSSISDDKTALYKRWTQVARDAGKVTDAVAVLEQAVAEFPADRELFYGLVALQLDLKEYGKLIGQLTRWTTANPTDTSALNLLHRLRSSTGASAQ
jgi:tetratricopeptide (TPR) repeat protein